ncbi:MAG: type II toxin-antitoxin system HicB family antitoxin [Deltaproteobacteria bacterium]|nr:type II toxin-antitoxin system HicB family antitoxin [Deltaproteobacteria bacterium]
MKYHFKAEKEDVGYSAQCVEIPGCITQGDTLKELNQNMKEALELVLDELPDSKYVAPLPNERIRQSKSMHIVSPDPQIALAHMVRYYRIKHKMTQKQIAKKMGFNDIYSYQRLESSNCNPTLKTILKIKEILPEISFDIAMA